MVAAFAGVLVVNLLLARNEKPVDAAWRIAGEFGYSHEDHYLKSASYHYCLLGGHCTVELRSRADVPALNPDLNLDSDPNKVHEIVEPAHSPRGARVTIDRSSGFVDWKLTKLEQVDLTSAIPAENEDDAQR